MNQLFYNHWAIENHLHWQLDVCFHEDQSQIRRDNAPENMATLRKIAGWNDQYLLQVLQNLRF